MADETQLPFLKHIEELRFRLIRAALGILVGTGIALSSIEPFFAFLTRPARGLIDGASFTFIGTAPADAFMAKLKVALVVGFLLSLPYTLLQLWRFLEPGLHEKEKKLAIPFVAAGTFFFLAGVTFCYIVVFPIAFRFFLDEYRSIGVEAHLRLTEYFEFVTMMLAVFGIIFELPILSYVLTRLQIIDHHWLIRHARGGIVTIFILAAILTPPDVMSQMCLAIPMLILYVLCLGIAYGAAPEKKKEAEAPVPQPPALTPVKTSVALETHSPSGRLPER